MQIKYLYQSARPYADTRSYYEVNGCAGKSDDEVKAFIGYKTEGEVMFGQDWQENYSRESDDKATFVTVTPFLD